MQELAQIASRMLELEGLEWTDSVEREWYELADELIRRLGVGSGVGQRRTVRVVGDRDVEILRGGEAFQGKLTDVSHRGLAVKGTLAGVKLGETVTLRIVSSIDGNPVRLSCLVVHKTPVELDECTIGFEIEKADPSFIERLYYPLYREYLQHLAAGESP